MLITDQVATAPCTRSKNDCGLRAKRNRSAREDSEAQRTRSLCIVINGLLRDDHSSGVTDRFSAVQVAREIRTHLARDHHTPAMSFLNPTRRIPKVNGGFIQSAWL